MSTLGEIFKKAEGIYEDLVVLMNEAKQALDDADKRQRALDVREQKVAGLESAAVVLEQARVLRNKVEQAQVDLNIAQADFDTFKTSELKKIAAERDALLPYVEIKEEVRKDKLALYEAQKALEVEKATYKEKVRQELVEHFKNTNGKG